MRAVGPGRDVAVRPRAARVQEGASGAGAGGAPHALLASVDLTPMVERTYPHEQVADALHRQTSGQARGKVPLAP